MWKRWNHGLILLLLIISLLQSQTIWAGQNGTGKEKAYKLPELRVKGAKGGMSVALSPDRVDMDLEDYHPTGSPSNIMDILKQRPIIDFRQASDLSPSNDEVQMRGFDPKMFVTAVNGVMIQKIGGHWGNHKLDFTTLPLQEVKEVEIIPGPHSPFYPGRSIGGVLNLKTKPPERRKTLKPDMKLQSSYSSYDTRNHFLSMKGNIQAFNYGLSYRHYQTDGYLRNNESELDIVRGKISYLLPSSGYARLSASHTDKLREIPVANDPSLSASDYPGSPGGGLPPGVSSDYGYDPDYPVVKNKYVRYIGPNHPRRKKDDSMIRLDAEKPTPLGTWKLNIYRKYADQVYKFDPDHLPKRAKGDASAAYTDWTTWGGKIQDNLELGSHDLTFGFDMAKLYSDMGDFYDHEIERILAGFGQDEWDITDSLTLKFGLRYSKQTIWWNNRHIRTGEYCIEPHKDYLEEEYDQLVPKSFLTYDLDNWADILRDTSVSLGVSRIWTPREFCSV